MLSPLLTCWQCYGVKQGTGRGVPMVMWCFSLAACIIRELNIVIKWDAQRPACPCRYIPSVSVPGCSECTLLYSAESPNMGMILTNTELCWHLPMCLLTLPPNYKIKDLSLHHNVIQNRFWSSCTDHDPDKIFNLKRQLRLIVAYVCMQASMRVWVFTFHAHSMFCLSSSSHAGWVLEPVARWCPLQKPAWHGTLSLSSSLPPT